ncbi:hypothetical protein D3C85_1235100 [compost metagenome]
MADLAGLDLLVEHRQGFFQCGERAVLMVIAELAEEVGRALRPVQLIEVDPVGLQAFEAGIQCRDQVLPVEFQVATADVVDAVAGAGDLARQYPVGAIAMLLEVFANELFGFAVGLGARWHRVHLGGVDEIDALGFAALDLGECLVNAVLFAPGHAAEAEGADAQIRAA